MNDKHDAERSPDFGVIFDNDGVLVDTEEFSETAYRIALQEQGLEVDPADAARYCGLTDADILLDMENRLGTKLDFERFSSRKRDLYFAAAGEQDMRVFPGALQLIKTLVTVGIPIALASSAPREKIDFNLQRSGLGEYFQHVVSGEDFERGKPDPQIFLTAAKCIGVLPAQCIVFEDSINGLMAARAAGMLAVGVPNTFPASQLQPHADVVVASLESLALPQLTSWLNDARASLS